jgi:hypothetical protein
MVGAASQGRHRQMYDVTCSDEVLSTERPIAPIKTTLLPGAGYKWVLVSSCWQVTKSQTMPLYPHDITMIVSHGRWVWTWELRPIP